jgi:hypothetical protein
MSGLIPKFTFWRLSAAWHGFQDHVAVPGLAGVDWDALVLDLRAQHQVPAAARDEEDLPVYWDRPPRTLGCYPV